jgi:hypothetical protein
MMDIQLKRRISHWAVAVLGFLLWTSIVTLTCALSVLVFAKGVFPADWQIAHQQLSANFWAVCANPEVHSVILILWITCGGWVLAFGMDNLRDRISSTVLFSILGSAIGNLLVDGTLRSFGYCTGATIAIAFTLQWAARRRRLKGCN